MRRADALADSDEDSFEASWGHFLATELMEDFDAEAALQALKPVASAGLDGMLRYANARNLIAQRFGDVGGALGASLPLVPFVTQARNVAIKTSFLNGVGRALSEQARYDESVVIFQAQAQLASKLGLRFVLPNALIGLAIAEHGRRQFARASTLRQRAETEAKACSDIHNLVECEILRIRLSIALGALDDAVSVHDLWFREPSSIDLGELTACRALAHACASELTRAEELVEESRMYVQVAQTRVYGAITLLVVAAKRSTAPEAARVALVKIVSETGSVDGVITACRSVPDLVPLLCLDQSFEPILTGALCRSRDSRILERTGRDAYSVSAVPGPTLSPREDEVFALLSRGMTNKQIGKVLYISDATVKVHLRHIYRKLGVTNRLEAVARRTAFFGADSP